MSLKSYIWLGLGIGGTMGGFLGYLLDHNNPLGLWSILLGSLGSLAGIWLSYRWYNN